MFLCVVKNCSCEKSLSEILPHIMGVGGLEPLPPSYATDYISI